MYCTNIPYVSARNRNTRNKNMTVDHSEAHSWLADSAPSLDSHTTLVCEGWTHIFPRTKGYVCKYCVPVEL